MLAGIFLSHLLRSFHSEAFFKDNKNGKGKFESSPLSLSKPESEENHFRNLFDRVFRELIQRGMILRELVRGLN
jgi:hypothetical protein